MTLKQEKLQSDTRRDFPLWSAELAVIKLSAGNQQNDRLREKTAWNTEMRGDNEDPSNDREERGRGRLKRRGQVGRVLLLWPEGTHGTRLETEFSAFLPTRWMTLDKSLHLSGPQFLYP